MKHKALLLILLVAALPCMAAITHTNTDSLILTNCADGSFSDFNWNWAGYDTEAIVLNWDTSLGAGTKASFRMRRPKDGVIYKEVLTGDITISTTQLTFTVDGGTNMVPVASYWGEVITYDTTTNVYRTVAQGMINVNWSLFKDDDDYFTYYTNVHSLAGSLIYYGTTSYIGNVTFSGAGVYSDGTNFTFTGVGTGAVASKFGRTGVIIANAADYASYYSTTNYSVVLSNAFASHRDANGTNVHGLGTMSLEKTNDFYTSTAADLLLAAKAGTNTVTPHIAATGTNVHGLGTMSLTDSGNYYTTGTVATLLAAKVNTGDVGTLAAFDDALSNGTAYVRQDGSWTSSAAAGGYVETNQWINTNAVLQSQIDTLTAGAYVHRYEVITNASENTFVLASTTNITASRSSTTITLTIPSETTLYSVSGRWNAPVLGASFKLVVGTNDMLNADITDQFACSFVAYREDTGRAIVGASATLDMVNFDRFTVEGLPTATVCKYHFGF